MYERINWTKYLDCNDKVAVRISYAHEGNGDNEASLEAWKEKLLTLGCRLLGRYDYQMYCTPQEFRDMYTYIRNFKFEEREITQEEIDALCSDKVKALLVMIREGCVCQINERLLLKYEQDPLLTKRIR